MFRQEFVRLWNHHILWGLLILLLVLNGGMFLRQYALHEQGTLYDTKDYVDVWSRLSEYPKEQRQDAFEKMHKVGAVLFENTLGTTGEQLAKKYDPEGTGWVFALLEQYHEHPHEVLITDSVYGDREVLAAVKREVDTVLEYPAYREEMKVRGEVLLETILTAQENGYNAKNLKKTLKDYAEADVPAIEGVYDNSKGVESMTFPLTGICVITLLLYAVGELFVYEKEQRLEALVRSNIRGKVPRLHSKLLVISLFVIIIHTLFFVENLVLSQAVFGLGDLSRPIQTVAAYVSATHGYTVAKYLFSLYMVRIVAFLTVAWLVAMLSAFVSNMRIMSIVSVLCIGLEFVLFYSIGYTSFFSSLKFINIVSAIRGDELLAVYRNVNVLGIPFTYLHVVMCLCAFLIVCSYVVLLVSFSRLYSEKEQCHWFMKLKRHREDKALPSYTVSLWKQELYRIGVLQKAAIFLPLVLMLGAWWIGSGYESKPENEDERYYQKYVQALEGPVTLETQEYICAEAARFVNLEERLIDLQQQQMADGVSNEEWYTIQLEIMLVYNQLAPKNAFERFCRYVDYLNSTGEGFIVDERPYEELFLDVEADIEMTMLIVIGMMLILPPIFAQDRETQMIGVLSVTKKGRRLLMVRMLFAGIVTILLVLIPCVVRYNAIADSYALRTNTYAYPACSIQGLSEYIGWSLGEYMVAAVGIRILGSCIVMLLMFGIVHMAKRTVLVWLLLIIVFALPLVAARLYTPLVNVCVHLSGMIGSSYYALLSLLWRVVVFAGLLTVGAVSYLVVHRKYSRL